METYRPLLMVFGDLIGIIGLVEFTAGRFDWMRAMANFMGGFFLAFSFFKLLNLRGFVDAYQTLRRAGPSGAGLGLGVAYLTQFAPVVTNFVTLVVMLVSAVGVPQVASRRPLTSL